MEKETGLWVSKNEGDREWRRPMRYLATTKNIIMRKTKLVKKKKKEKTRTPSEGIPSHTKLDD